MSSEPSKGRHHHEEGKRDPDDDPDAVQDRSATSFAAQRFHGLRLNFGLQYLDLNFLVGNLFSLIDDLLLEACAHRILSFLLLM